MNTHNVNTAASESSKTWVEKICVNATSLDEELQVSADSLMRGEGFYYPTRNGEWGRDFLVFDRAEVSELMSLNVTSLKRITSSAGSESALYDTGINSPERYIISRSGTIHKRLGNLFTAAAIHRRLVLEILTRNNTVFMEKLHEALAAGLDLYVASSVAKGHIPLEKALHPDRNFYDTSAHPKDCDITF